jgi:Fe2+ or Zn2+ uptake regulation protein
VDLNEPDVASRLRSAGLRVTAPRLAVYDAVAAAPHSDADSVEGVVRTRLGTVSTQGVYDALRVLTEQGLLRRIEPAGSSARYETRIGDNHHHVVCRSCGTTGDVDCAVNAAPCLEASDTHGFTIDEAEVTYWGLCPSCQQHART